MAGVNKAILIGNLGRDPEIRYSQQGTAVVNFSIATSEQWTDKQGQKQEKTEWHNIVVFGKMAENCGKYLSKGSKVYVEGRIETSSYEKEGQTHYMTKIVASTVQFLSGRQEGGTGGYQSEGAQGNHSQNSGGGGSFQGYTNPGMQGPGPEPDDDIPF